MATLPQPGAYRPETAILTLGERFLRSRRAGRFPAGDAALPQRPLGGGGRARRPERRRMDPPFRAASRRCRTISRTPLALRYHGHQFRVYNPDIGDGRGFLFAQLRDAGGRLLDLGTKGSGQTPYSRFGDGRLTLKGGDARDARHRDAGGARRRDLEDLLADRDRRGAGAQRRALPHPLGRARPAPAQPYPDRHLPAAGDARRGRQYPQAHRLLPAPLLCRPRAAIPPRLLGQVARAGAPARRLLYRRRLRPRRAQFGQYRDHRAELRLRPLAVHARIWDGAFTAAYFDHAGLYSFGRQPEAIHWDLVQLAARAPPDRRGRRADAQRSRPSPICSSRLCATPLRPARHPARRPRRRHEARRRASRRRSPRRPSRSTASSSTGAAAASRQARLDSDGL